MNDAQERRRFTRVSFAHDARLTQAGHSYSVELIDLSLAGALVVTPEAHKLNANSNIALTIMLEGGIDIDMMLSLAHCHENYLGFHCESIDVESMGHLRRLIELNMEEENASERVLQELISACA